jgi:RNA polymerase sigma factor (sigma-70 family)
MPTGRRLEMQKLLDDFLTGDARAAENVSRLVTFFLLKLRVPAPAVPDLAQDVLVKLFTRGHTIEDPSVLPAWLRTTTRHHYFAWRRREQRSVPVEDVPEAEPVAEDASSLGLSRCVDELPEAERELVHVHYVRGMTMTESMAALALTEGQFRYLRKKALRQLRLLLLAEPAEVDPTGGRLPDGGTS